MIPRSWIGHETPTSTLVLDRARLRFFAKAIGETDPVYTSLEAAHAAGYPDLPAPPTFVFSAEMDSGVTDQLLQDLGIPFERLLHGEQGFTFHRMAFAGDTLSVRSRITDVYCKKGGALEFVVKTATAHNQRGELVAELRAVVVHLNPEMAA